MALCFTEDMLPATLARIGPRCFMRWRSSILIKMAEASRSHHHHNDDNRTAVRKCRMQE